MISFGKSEYIPDLKNMWHKIFGDSEDYLNSFFNKVYKNENTLVYVENNKVVSVLFMIPYKYVNSGKENEIVYLYALATDPAYRGRKIMSKLIQKSLTISTERGYALSVLIPAEDTLFSYYRQFGFEDYFEQVKIIKSIEEIENELSSNENLMQQGQMQVVQLQEVQMQEVKRKEVKHKQIEFIKADARQIYDAYSHSKIYMNEGVILSYQQNEFYIEELLKEGGQAFVFDLNRNRDRKEDGYVLLKFINDNLYIYETNIDSNNLNLFYKALLKIYAFKKITFYQPICFGEEETKYYKKTFAMAKRLSNIDIKEPFLNRLLM